MEWSLVINDYTSSWLVLPDGEDGSSYLIGKVTNKSALGVGLPDPGEVEVWWQLENGCVRTENSESLDVALGQVAQLHNLLQVVTENWRLSRGNLGPVSPD